MNFFKKLLKDDEIYDDKFKDEYMSDGQGDEMIDDIPPADGVSGAGDTSSRGADVSLRVMKPKSYDDGPEIADYVASGCTVVMNIEDLNRENARRLIDFLLGVVHVLGGDLQMASQTTFVVAPCSVSVPESSEDDPDSEFTFR